MTSSTSTPAPTPTQSSKGAVTVSGNNLLRDGVVWAPHGVVSIAFVTPPAAQQGILQAAYNNFSTAELTAMKAWGADTVRFQVSQPGLDPQNNLYTASFVSAVENGVLAARSAGLNVIVSVQDESQSGETNPTPLLDAATQRVWQVLAPVFNSDTGILYEMINEPQPLPSLANWAAWATAMNAVVTTIRNTGSSNVVVADGLDYAQYLDGAPALTDPKNEVAYASHPYFFSAAAQTSATWQTKFGNFSATAPVIITEWTTNTHYYCDSNTPTAVLSFLQYLQNNGIGLAAYAYDSPGNPAKAISGSIVQSYSGTPTTFANGIQCGAVGFGPGTLIQNWYKTGSVPTTLE